MLVWQPIKDLTLPWFCFLFVHIILHPYFTFCAWRRGTCLPKIFGNISQHCSFSSAGSPFAALLLTWCDGLGNTAGQSGLVCHVLLTVAEVYKYPWVPGVLLPVVQLFPKSFEDLQPTSPLPCPRTGWALGSFRIISLVWAVLSIPTTVWPPWTTNSCLFPVNMRYQCLQSFLSEQGCQH